MEGVENLLTLRKLELYDNQIEQISSLEKLSNLRILDLSFNAIRSMIPDLASCCPQLEGTYSLFYYLIYCVKTSLFHLPRDK
jgi:Leucine-rich repeat (LRR) protein